MNLITVFVCLFVCFFKIGKKCTIKNGVALKTLSLESLNVSSKVLHVSPTTLSWEWRTGTVTQIVGISLGSL